MPYILAVVLVSGLLFVASPEAADRADASRPLQEAHSAESGSKSSKLAFLMSLAVPGLGELYSGATLRAVGFMAVEAFTWVSYARWRSKGNGLKADFRRFADQHWVEARYRAWQVYNNGRGSANYIETETLPTKGEDIQQYYELVGKYDQFVYGWDDVWNPAFPEPNAQVDSALRLSYETQRNESNKFLKRASVVIGLAVLNRIVSAIHASAYTRTLQEQARSKRIQVHITPLDTYGRTAPTLSLSAQF